MKNVGKKSSKTRPSTVSTKDILDADLKAYQTGNYKPLKGNTTDVVINGRVYGLKNNGTTIFPRGGSDKFIKLTQGQIKAIKTIQNTPANKLNSAVKGADISADDLNFAKDFIKKYGG